MNDLIGAKSRAERCGSASPSLHQLCKVRLCHPCFPKCPERSGPTWKVLLLLGHWWSRDQITDVQRGQANCSQSPNESEMDEHPGFLCPIWGLGPLGPGSADFLCKGPEGEPQALAQVCTRQPWACWPSRGSSSVRTYEK